MARYVRACYCAKMAHKFRALFRLQFFVSFAVTSLPQNFCISLFFVYCTIILYIYIFFFLGYSSKFNDFASALGLVNQIVAEYCLLFSQAISTVVLFNCLLPARRFKCVSEMVWLASLR